MADRQTMNVSLPLAQEQFVRTQVAGGRYKTASEVIRDGLRLLEEAEHRRLVEKWLYEDVSEDEIARLPVELKTRVQTHFRDLIEEGLRSAEKQGWIDGPTAMQEIRARLRARSEKAS